MVQILKDITESGLGTLASQTALIVETSHATGMLESFLMKKVKATVTLKSMTDNEGPIIVGMARGDASITQIKAALENIQLERDGLKQAENRLVCQETLTTLMMDSSGGLAVKEIEISLGGGKGIPFGIGDGWQWFVYNADVVGGGLTSGGYVNVNATYYGVWL